MLPVKKLSVESSRDLHQLEASVTTAFTAAVDAGIGGEFQEIGRGRISV